MMNATVKEMILSGLNEEQCRAVTAPEGPVAVFAGPGSGKTTVLTRRILYLLEQGNSANQLMVVTFTRAAAQEMKARLEQIAPGQSKEMYIGTFHSLFFRMLRESGEFPPPLLGAKEQAGWIREILGQKEQPADEETIGTYLNQIGLCKGNAILPGQLKVQKQKNVLFRDVFSAYEERKKAEGVWDYDDILLAVYSRLKRPGFRDYWQNRFRHLLVDEFQDINRVQYDVLIQLAAGHRCLFAVGDDDQAIYGFRGSDPRFMLKISEDFPEARRIILTVNYRSTEEIIGLSERLIRKNRLRQPKTRIGTGKTGTRINWWEPEDENDEARRILLCLRDGKESAILFRTLTQARAIIDELVRRNIPFFVNDGSYSFYRRFQVQDMFAYLKLASDPNDLDALARIINKPKRYLFGEEWLDALWNLARKRNLSLLEALPHLPGLEPYQIRYFKEMREHVFSLKNMSAAAAIRAIRETIGYDRYLKAFAQETGSDLTSLMEPADELLLAAEPFSDGQALMEHAKKVEARLKIPDEQAKVKLMTFHRSKGLEFDRVFLIGLHAMVLPHYRSLQVPEQRKNAAWEEERRLFYVGITRARKELYLSASKTRQGKRSGISPFLKEMGFAGGEESDRDPVLQPKRLPEAAAWRQRSREQPQLRFSHEEVAQGMRVNHIKFGEGVVTEVARLEGVAPGRKIMVRFADGLQSLHYELSRQLGLIELHAKKP
ncbi:ATP-dependent helicase [Thermoactinomyces sp. CICC 10521]|uniref:ATP-dependent helicase n=1 Tax=Thermoactinomyces sp. CICC 10521 TaxID=2767426 RepID=UPI0018DB020F|nr:ATP-dependent helicase [Thermoactinomyces sp. CICC 10521]MBH8607814.1 ATP-dependent helicase [Thermoactinomyces sp. CICC 10521]